MRRDCMTVLDSTVCMSVLRKKNYPRDNDNSLKNIRNMHE